MDRVSNPVVGKKYVTSLFNFRIVKVLEIKGDFVKCNQYAPASHYYNCSTLKKNKDSIVIHKSLLFEEPKVWSDIPSNYLLDHILGKIKYKTRIYDKLKNLKFERFDIKYYEKLCDDVRQQTFSELLKVVIPKCNFSQLCILRNLFQEVHYMDEKITRLEVYKEYEGELTTGQLFALEENLALYRKYYAKANNEKYYYCGLEWRRKNSICDLHHYLHGLNTFLTDDKFYTMTLFPVADGDIRGFNAIDFSQKLFDPNSSLQSFVENINKTSSLSGRDNSFNVIIEYFMTEGLGEDPHNKSIEIPDFINPDYHNIRCLTRSVKSDWFRYLIYITGRELKELYDTKINKGYRNKQAWAFVLEGDLKAKYYLLIK